jgi:hypothetical protein
MIIIKIILGFCIHEMPVARQAAVTGSGWDVSLVTVGRAVVRVLVECPFLTLEATIADVCGNPSPWALIEHDTVKMNDESSYSFIQQQFD